jgi:hypothetical protein
MRIGMAFAQRQKSPKSFFPLRGRTGLFRLPQGGEAPQAFAHARTMALIWFSSSYMDGEGWFCSKR